MLFPSVTCAVHSANRTHRAGHVEFCNLSSVETSAWFREATLTLQVEEKLEEQYEQKKEQQVNPPDSNEVKSNRKLTTDLTSPPLT